MCFCVWLEFDRPEVTLWGWQDAEILVVVVVVVVGLVLVVVAPKQLNSEVNQCRLKVLDIKI